jgi:hypothetical protein
MTPEGVVKKEVATALKALLSCGDIYYWTRLQSGQFQIGDCYVHACEPGTFDMLVVFPDKEKNLVLAFVELKRKGIKAFLSDSQKAFKAKYDGKHVNIKFWLVQSAKEIRTLIRESGYDRLKDIDL